MIFPLVQDFADVLGEMPSSYPRRRVLELLAEAVRRDAHFLDRHPTALFQCLWNTCWWYDCPAAEGHYEAPRAKRSWWIWGRSRAKLCTLLERWRRRKDQATPGHLWLRSLWPPPNPLGTAQKAIIYGHQSEVTCVDFSPDGTRVVSGSADQTVRLWDVVTGKELRAWRGHNRPVLAIRFSPDGARVVSGSEDGTACVWDVDGETAAAVMHMLSGPVYCVAWSPDGARIVCGAYWDASVWTAAGAAVGVLRGHANAVRGVSYSPAGDQLASGGEDGTVRRWDATTLEEVDVFRSDGGEVVTLEYSATGLRAVTRKDRTLRVWDVDTRAELAALAETGDRTCCAAVSPDGRRVVTGSYSRIIQVWDVHAGAEAAQRRGHGLAVLGIAFSADGTYLASAGKDRTVRLWATTGGADPRPHHQDQIYIGSTYYSTYYSDDGRLLHMMGTRSLTGEGVTLLWDAATGRELAEFIPIGEATAGGWKKVVWNRHNLRHLDDAGCRAVFQFLQSVTWVWNLNPLPSRLHRWAMKQEWRSFWRHTLAEWRRAARLPARPPTAPEPEPPPPDQLVRLVPGEAETTFAVTVPNIHVPAPFGWFPADLETRKHPDALRGDVYRWEPSSVVANPAQYQWATSGGWCLGLIQLEGRLSD